MGDTILHEDELSRYTLMRDGKRIGQANYEIHGNAIHFTHTGIEPSLREHGLGGKLVRHALDHVRTTTDYRVVALYPFVEDWIRRHPDYQDLTERPGTAESEPGTH